MPQSKVFYLQKSDNPPHYYAGQELHTIEYDRGWVEYLKETSDVYYSSGLTLSQYQKFLPTALNFIICYYQQNDFRIMSLLKNLCQQRMEHDFDLPLFCDLRQGTIFSCGRSRFTASVLCGVEPSDIPVVFQTAKGQPVDGNHQTVAVTSTKEINQLAGLINKEFRLIFSQDDCPTVLSSILRNSIYEGDSDYKTFEEDGKNIFEFWNRYTVDNRINLTVSCNQATRDLIKFDPDIWNINFVDYDHRGFSFGEILGKFGEKGPGGLNLYVYDIKESFHLEYLLPWTHPNHVWYHTLNKKVHLFDTSRGSSSACWPIVAIGNFVK